MDRIVASPSFSLVLSPSLLPQLKLLKVVLKNLSDPMKSKDPKYRQLKLDNEKIRSKLVVHPAVMNYLKSLGFLEPTKSCVCVSVGPFFSWKKHVDVPTVSLVDCGTKRYY